MRIAGFGMMRKDDLECYVYAQARHEEGAIALVNGDPVVSKVGVWILCNESVRTGCLGRETESSRLSGQDIAALKDGISRRICHYVL